MWVVRNHVNFCMLVQGKGPNQRHVPRILTTQNAEVGALSFSSLGYLVRLNTISKTKSWQAGSMAKSICSINLMSM